jgi:hypothetical protein
MRAACFLRAGLAKPALRFHHFSFQTPFTKGSLGSASEAGAQTCAPDRSSSLRSSAEAASSGGIRETKLGYVSCGRHIMALTSIGARPNGIIAPATRRHQQKNCPECAAGATAVATEAFYSSQSARERLTGSQRETRAVRSLPYLRGLAALQTRGLCLLSRKRPVPFREG